MNERTLAELARRIQSDPLEDWDTPHTPNHENHMSEQSWTALAERLDRIESLVEGLASQVAKLTERPTSAKTDVYRAVVGPQGIPAREGYEDGAGEVGLFPIETDDWTRCVGRIACRSDRDEPVPPGTQIVVSRERDADGKLLPYATLLRDFADFPHHRDETEAPESVDLYDSEGFEVAASDDRAEAITDAEVPILPVDGDAPDAESIEGYKALCLKWHAAAQACAEKLKATEQERDKLREMSDRLIGEREQKVAALDDLIAQNRRQAVDFLRQTDTLARTVNEAMQHYTGALGGLAPTATAEAE